MEMLANRQFLNVIRHLLRQNDASFLKATQKLVTCCRNEMFVSLGFTGAILRQYSQAMRKSFLQTYKLVPGAHFI